MLNNLLTWLKIYLPKNKKGQDLTEYALLVALIAIVVVAAVIIFGQEISTFFSEIVTEVQSWPTVGGG